MNKVVNIEILDDYTLKLLFQDSAEKIVSIRPFIGKGFTEELLDKSNFEKVEIDEGGGICWPNGYDFCPNFLRELQTEEEVTL